MALVLVYQLSAFDPTHDENHARHCCPACHAGHMLATAELAIITQIPPVEARWYAPVEASESAAERALVAGSSRAPPA
jgi:hypothetical protein